VTVETLPTTLARQASSRKVDVAPFVERPPSLPWPGLTAPDAERPDDAHQLVQRLFLPRGGPDRQTAVLFAAVDRHAAAGELCGRVAELLAANSEGFVCVVDADLRRPTLDEYFGTAFSPGLADVLQDQRAAREVALQVRPNLWFVPAGSASADPLASFGSARARSLFHELRTVFKHVVVNAAPLGGFDDGVLLGQWVDGVVLAVEAHQTHREKARRVKERLDVARVPLLGVVLTNRRFPIPSWLSGWL
jgi:Mrp family chromosome partitioning ATPase